MGLSVIESNTVIQESITNKKAFGIASISEQTDLSVAYLRKKIKDGELKATRFGTRVLVLKDDLEKFLKDGCK